MTMCFLGCVALVAGYDSPQTAASSSINVLPAQLVVQPPAENWLSYNGDYSGRRYSSLSKITPANVTQLRAQWVFHSHNSHRLDSTPYLPLPPSLLPPP